MPEIPQARPLEQTLAPPAPWPAVVPRGGKVFVIGADIGQIHDPTAVAVVQHLVTCERASDLLLGTPPLYVTHFQVLGCERRPLGESYPLVAKRLCQLARRLVDRHSDASLHLIMDQTGVGKPVLDLVRESIDTHVMVTGCTITGGSSEKGAHDLLWRESVSVSKAFIVSRLQSLLQGGRIKMPKCPETELLKQELSTFEIRIKPATGTTESGAFTVGAADDLCIALGLSVASELSPLLYHGTLGDLGSPVL